MGHGTEAVDLGNRAIIIATKPSTKIKHCFITVLSIRFEHNQ